MANATLYFGSGYEDQIVTNYPEPGMSCSSSLGLLQSGILQHQNCNKHTLEKTHLLPQKYTHHANVTFSQWYTVLHYVLINFTLNIKINIIASVQLQNVLLVLNLYAEKNASGICTE